MRTTPLILLLSVLSILPAVGKAAGTAGFYKQRLRHDLPAFQAPSLTLLADQLDMIQPGMTRAEVEHLVAPALGLQAEIKTYYLVGNGYIISVPFDQSGGLWNDQNRVNSFVKPLIRRAAKTLSSKL